MNNCFLNQLILFSPLQLTVINFYTPLYCTSFYIAQHYYENYKRR